MKVSFEGTPQQIRAEMLQWLSKDQKSTAVKDSVTHKLQQHNIRLTQNENDVLPLTFVKQVCQLEGLDWKLFKQELEKCGVKQKRTSTARILTNLTVIEEE